MTGQASGGHIGSQAQVLESNALPVPKNMSGQVACTELSRRRLIAEIFPMRYGGTLVGTG
jgi:hypothetical protein